jgi:hypothetical protein
MDLRKQFDTIRPYNDQEVKPAIERLISHPHFDAVMGYLFRDTDLEELKQHFLSLETVHQFQVFFSNYTVGKIVELSSGGLTDQGAEHLDTDSPYLFVGNHRDIVLDAAIMQFLLHRHGHRTSQITFGENLMFEQLLLDLGKLNKMFTFYRGGTKVEQYQKALVNSAYINHVIKEEKESIWIAQRNGRTKNGDDRTQTGLIKMFAVGSREITDWLARLNIVPVTISYEVEPCDIQKVRELYLSREKPYEKAEGEDLRSILAGITGNKGRIHYVFGTPLNEFIRSLDGKGLHDNEIIDKITEEIDRQVHRDYRLWPSNYLACDLLLGEDRFGEHYTEGEKAGFLAAMEGKLSLLEGFDQAVTRRLFLDIYANPVINRHGLRKKSPGEEK